MNSRTIFQLLLLALFPSWLMGQALNFSSYPILDAIDQGKLRKGFYASYEDFVNNSPTHLNEIGFQMEHVPLRVDWWQKIDAYRFSTISWQTGRDLGKIWGYCDGENVYKLMSRRRLHNRSLFVKMDRIHDTFIFEGYGLIGFRCDDQLPVLNPLHDGCRLVYRLDVKVGEMEELTSFQLSRLLKETPEILEEYRNEKWRFTKMLDYLEKHQIAMGQQAVLP